jgi:hypothetical protein
VSDGKIAILFKCSRDDEEKFAEAMKTLGAESVGPAVARPL